MRALVRVFHQRHLHLLMKRCFLKTKPCNDSWLNLYSNLLEQTPESKSRLYAHNIAITQVEADHNQEIAFFSYDSEHKLKPLDNESLRYYYPPFFNVPGHQDNRFPVDLSKGYNSFRQRDDSGDEHLDGLLDTLVEAEKRNGKKTEVDLVTWRGMMTRVCLS
jgi:hypothetical protein